jgi:stress-induced morphogen
MAMDIRDQIASRIKSAYAGAEITLTDMTGTQDHWEAMIVAPEFHGMSRLQRQRGVYAALGELMTGPIHALTFRTLTPEQFESENP